MKAILLRLGIGLAACSLLLVAGCGDDSDAPTGPAAVEFDFGPILDNFTDNVVIATYADLDERAGELLAAIEALSSDTTPENLSAARNAWVATRIPWEASEGFLFGPVDFNGYDPALDSWPVNRTDLDGVLASDNDLTTAYVNSLDGTLKGFHTIEYLLFDEGGSKTATDFTEREFAYLIATTQDLKATTEALHTSWIASGGNFGQKVRNAGSGSDAYPSAQSAVQEMVGGMIGICDEVANGKIADPFVEQDTRLVESQFSFNSIADFQNNLRSVLHVYTGDYASTRPGLRRLHPPSRRRPRSTAQTGNPDGHRRDRQYPAALPRRHRLGSRPNRNGTGRGGQSPADLGGRYPAAVVRELMLRSTWPVVGFRSDSLWDRGQDALDSMRPMAVGGGLKPPPTWVRNISRLSQ